MTITESRFVLLRHDCPPNYPRSSHFDLMLEVDGTLRTWALPDALVPEVVQTVDALPDHRLHYLDYEGPVSGDRGWVSRVDRGSYRAHEVDATHFLVELHGEQLQGMLRLERVGPDEQRWRLVLETPSQSS